MNPFGPIAETKSDGAFLTDLPHKLLQEGKIHKLPWINSNTEQDLAMVAGSEYLVSILNVTYINKK